MKLSNRIRTLTPGLLLSLVFSIAAYLLGTVFPLIGAPILALIFGALFNQAIRKPKTLVPGLSFSSKKILQWAIVAFGCSINLQQIWETGSDTLFVLFFTFAAVWIATALFARMLKIDDKLKQLIGVGTAICGGSAIAAVAPIIGAAEMEIALSVSTIFLYNVLAALAFPLFGHLMGMSDQAFGLWAGTAINDTSSVVAAGFAYSNEAGTYATIVKLTRTAFIIPICIAFAIQVSKAAQYSSAGRQTGISGILERIKHVFPWFILYFLAASLLQTVHLIPADAVPHIVFVGKLMIGMALFAVGTLVDVKAMIKTGGKPVLLGGLVWLVLIFTCLIVQWATGQLP